MFGELIANEFGCNGVVVTILSKNHSLMDVLFYIN